MPVPDDLLNIFQCPICASSIEVINGKVVCIADTAHMFPEQDGFVSFSEAPAGKYDESYAARYAALWAYGYQTINTGSTEPLYRTVASLFAECLVESMQKRNDLVVLDAGCGVGRTTIDCAELMQNDWVIGIDTSDAMLSIAGNVGLGKEIVEIDLSDTGYGMLSIPAREKGNIVFSRADAENIPIKEATIDIVLTVNIVDRLPQGPEAALAECYRVLRPGGFVIFTDPMNWNELWLWQKYPDQRSLLDCFETYGFEIIQWFDQLIYSELLDKRGAIEQYPSLVVLGKK